MTVTLSVSSADRVWVWPCPDRPTRSGTTPFSILGGSSVGVAQRIRVRRQRSRSFSILGGSSVGVALPRRGRRAAPRPFSILGGSSVGVAQDAVDVQHLLYDFQYPRRIECGCGSPSPFLPALRTTLSVSSADRVWVWRPPPAWPREPCTRFQYPRRIECGCGTATKRPSTTSANFQYPRRIECGCGQRERHVLQDHRQPFSILGGSSVGVATALAPLAGVMAAFSILGGSSVGVAQTHPTNPSTCPSFSILGGSSVGVAKVFAEHLQQTNHLSVSSADRVWVWRAPRPCPWRL